MGAKANCLTFLSGVASALARDDLRRRRGRAASEAPVDTAPRLTNFGRLQRPSYLNTYAAHLANLRAAHGEEGAMDLIVGGQSRAIGILEHSVLATLGLRPTDTIVDIGCGSGRLSTRLAPTHAGVFIGTDLLQDVIDYAARKANRPDWRFLVAQQPPLPIADGIADYVCFFSVFTHLLDEDIYRYLQDAARLLKPGGKIVFSYLDFAVVTHWTMFELTVADRSPDPVLNKFISKDAIHAWAQHLGLRVEQLHDGPAEWIDLLEPIAFSDGRQLSGRSYFGQSVAVVSKIG